NAQQAAINLLKAGVDCQDLQNISQQVLDDSGFGKWAGQALGHGVGLFLHELPFINKNCRHVLEAGNVITSAPGS
ncbi:M24 family metallopeptidase, partial [Pseudoalteromonas sp. S1649]|uniref:M24 family metallopeptidase n=1 Tax=Pseudoalteromonas sp. S1649 TaxID=579508 RepID=UPI0020180EB3